MKSTLFLQILVFHLYSVFAQNTNEIKLTKIPEQIKYEGIIQASDSWKDKNGMNYFLITITEQKDSVSSDDNFDSHYLTKFLYAYHYVQNGDLFTLSRKITDFIKNCEFDLILYYETGSLSITDLDKNGINEVSFVYKLTCTSDVSPYDMKLIILENGKKYPVRGTGMIKYDEESIFGGEYKLGEEFNQAPAEFKSYAKQKWDKFKIIKF